MSAPSEHIQWVPLLHIVPGTNTRTVKPRTERIADYARSIARYGVLVPLLAEQRDSTYHLHAGHTRLAALHQVRDDKHLSRLAQRNGVDLHRVPVRLVPNNNRNHLLLPMLENNLRDPLNDVDAAALVQLLVQQVGEVQCTQSYGAYAEQQHIGGVRGAVEPVRTGLQRNGHRVRSVSREKHLSPGRLRLKRRGVSFIQRRPLINSARLCINHRR